MNKRKILSIILGFLTAVFAFLAWWSVKNAVVTPQSSTWIVPMVLFSIYIILICLDIILISEILLLELLLIGSLALSLTFAFTWLQLGGTLLSGYFIFLSSRRIKEDIDFNLKISIRKSLQVGKSYLLISITLLIVILYFNVVNNFEGEKKVPNFDAGFITKKIAIPFLSGVNPQFKALKDEKLTVDKFILQTQADTLQNMNLSLENEKILDSQLPANLNPDQREMLKRQNMENFSNVSSKLSQKTQELILAEQRKKLSDVVGVELTGGEKISDVFTGLIDNKINAYFNPKVPGEEKNSVFAMILAIVLLLTIYPIGSILSIAWFLIVKFVVYILFRLKVLEIRVITVQKEIME